MRSAASSGVAVSCPASVTYTGAAQTPCTAMVSGPGGLAAPVTPSYTNNVVAGAVSGLVASDVGTVTCTTKVPTATASGTYATTPLVSPAVPANYAMTLVNGTLTVTGFVQQSCFSSPLINGTVVPTSPSTISKGSSITIKCRLVDGAGRPVEDAGGSLRIEDRGTNGLTIPSSPAYNGTNVFRHTGDGDHDSDDGWYAYTLSTQGSQWIRGHCYFVTATWSDGTQTKGWFVLR